MMMTMVVVVGRGAASRVRRDDTSRRNSMSTPPMGVFVMALTQTTSSTTGEGTERMAHKCCSQGFLIFFTAHNASPPFQFNSFFLATRSIISPRGSGMKGNPNRIPRRILLGLVSAHTVLDQPNHSKIELILSPDGATRSRCPFVLSQ